MRTPKHRAPRSDRGLARTCLGSVENLQEASIFCGSLRSHCNVPCPLVSPDHCAGACSFNLGPPALCRVDTTGWIGSHRQTCEGYTCKRSPHSFQPLFFTRKKKHGSDSPFRVFQQFAFSGWLALWNETPLSRVLRRTAAFPIRGRDPPSLRPRLGTATPLPRRGELHRISGSNSRAGGAWFVSNCVARLFVGAAPFGRVSRETQIGRPANCELGAVELVSKLAEAEELPARHGKMNGFPSFLLVSLSDQPKRRLPLKKQDTTTYIVGPGRGPGFTSSFEPFNVDAEKRLEIFWSYMVPKLRHHSSAPMPHPPAQVL